MSRQRSDPTIRSCVCAIKNQTALSINFVKYCLSHELRNGRVLRGGQIKFENSAVRQNGIEVFYKTAVSIGTSNVVAPGFEAEWKEVSQQRTLYFGVAQILRVVPEIAGLSPLSRM